MADEDYQHPVSARQEGIGPRWTSRLVDAHRLLERLEASRGSGDSRTIGHRSGDVGRPGRRGTPKTSRRGGPGRGVKQLPADAVIYLCGENDRKAAADIHGDYDDDCTGCLKCWPGKYGVEFTAQAVAIAPDAVCGSCCRRGRTRTSGFSHRRTRLRSASCRRRLQEHAQRR